MGESTSTCPKCGADKERDPQWALAFECGSHYDYHPGEIFTPKPERLCETPTCLRNQLAALQAIIDKLPKYADTGGPIVPGQDRVWLIGPHWMGEDPWCLDSPAPALLVSWWGDHACVQVEPHEGCDYWDGPMYSTHAAAEAAAAKEGKS